MANNHTLVMRTTKSAHDFVATKAGELGITKTDVMRKMFAYAATNMKDADWGSSQKLP
jgi:hypothetical protein